MAGVLSETTVAAPQTPFLHESVNAVPGQTIGAAKVGNATACRESEARRDAGQYQEAMLAGAIVGHPAVEEWTPETAFEQLDGCEYRCEGGPLTLNVAYQWLKEQMLG